MCRIVLGGSELFTVRCPKLGSKCSQIDIEEWGFWHLCRTLFGDFILLHFFYASFQSREKNRALNDIPSNSHTMVGINKFCPEIILHFFFLHSHTCASCFVQKNFDKSKPNIVFFFWQKWKVVFSKTIYTGFSLIELILILSIQWTNKPYNFLTISYQNSYCAAGIRFFRKQN